MPSLNPHAISGTLAAPTVYRGRFAPSPTGPLHLGSLYTALASYLEARSHGGQWLVRIDDIDTPRVVRGAGDDILRTLARFGLESDEAVVWQSRRLDVYQTALHALDQANLLYACTCTRKHLQAHAQDAGDLSPYPGYCREGKDHRNVSHALRVRTSKQVIAFVDRLQGAYRTDFSQEVGDFIVYRRDRIHAYHLATVIDDDQTGITEVLRGSDLLPSTPRQILLQRLLGLPTPSYLHIPLIVDRDGVKLSKQTGAPPIDPREPSTTIFKLLALMLQNPPMELSKAPCSELLDWATAHWDVQRLKNNITVTSTTLV